jgi:hypothetical protein
MSEASEDLFEIADLYPATTGLPMTVWVSPRGAAPHDVRIKVKHDPQHPDDDRQHGNSRRPAGFEGCHRPAPRPRQIRARRLISGKSLLRAGGQ